MARRISAGSAGGAGVGGLNITSTSISAADDLNVTVDPKGTGIFEVAGDQQLNAQSDLRFADSDSSNWVAFQAPATVASNVTWTLPDADATTANQSLVSDSAGTLSWVTTGAQISDESGDGTANYIIFGTATSSTLLNVRVNSSDLTYTPGTGELAATQADFNGTVKSLLLENTTTTSKNLALTDQNRVVACNNTTDITITVPLNTTVPHPIGTVIYVYRYNTGGVQITAEAGVTLNQAGGLGGNEQIVCRKRDTDIWHIEATTTNLTASGGTVSTSSGYTVHTYTSIGSGETFAVD